MPVAPTYRIRNWSEFQHYGAKRSPPWIKLHRGLLNNREWHALSGDASKLLVECWLVASETPDGSIPLELPDLAWRLRRNERETAALVEELVAQRFLEPCTPDASAALATRKQGASLDVREEKRVEEETDANASEPQAARTAAPARDVIPMPPADRALQSEAAALIREHLWLGPDPPPDTDMARELSVWGHLAKAHGAREVNGALTVCRKALRLTAGPLSIRVLYPKGRRDRVNDAIRWWRTEQEKPDPTKAGAVLGALLGGARG